MKKNKGFTLVEILAVIVILGVVALIAVPSVEDVIIKNKEKLYNSQIETIKDGLKTFASTNNDFLPSSSSEPVILTLEVLKIAGFAKQDIKNPITNKCFSNDMVLTINSVKSGYTYHVDEESGLDGTEEDCSVKNDAYYFILKGNSQINVDIESLFIDPGYFAYNGQIENDKVTRVIKDKDGVVVTSVDTKTIDKSPYTIAYTYKNKTLTRIVNVTDQDPIGTEYVFQYTGSVQNITLKPARYKFEVWGAQGGYRSTQSMGGNGGYASGEIALSSITNLFIYVGGSGNTGGPSGGFNGGGKRSSYNGGGGASDIRISTDSLYSRVIVTGGGASDGASNKTGMYGGGSSGGSSTQSYGTGGTGGTQIGNSWLKDTPGTGTTSSNDAYASFGVGGNGVTLSGGYGGAGGGGWYGGAGAVPDSSGDDDRGGGGGSGWVYTSAAFTTWQTSNSKDALNYLLTSQYYLTNTQLLAGNTAIPTYDGASTTVGNIGNGYVKITKLS